MSHINSLRILSNLDFSNQAFDATLATICLDSCRHNPVLVEGEKDKTLLKDFFTDNANFIFTGSKSNVKKIIDRTFRLKTNIVGICDRDYEQLTYSSKPIFYYDFNNLEMMLINDNSVFESESYKVLGLSTESLISIKDRALTILYPVSVLRLVRSERNINLSLDEVVPTDDLLIRQSSEENIRCIKTNILNKLTTLSQNERMDLIYLYALRLEQMHDLHCITQGHDFVRIFRKLLACLGEERFYKISFDSFSFEMFKRTKLFSSLRNYERMESLILLKTF